MPLYDYRCDLCGEFEAWRKLAELQDPMMCPTCQGSTKRIFSPPNISLNSSFSIRKKEAKEPRLVKREIEPAKPKAREHTGSRPWMIGHAPPVF
jgi:putative FmdB family regulatory protein